MHTLFEWNGTHSATNDEFTFRISPENGTIAGAACVTSRILAENKMIIIRFISFDWRKNCTGYGRRSRSEMSDAQLNLSVWYVGSPVCVSVKPVARSTCFPPLISSRACWARSARCFLPHHKAHHTLTHTFGASELDSFDGFTCLQCVRARVYMPIHLSGNIWRRRKQMAFASHHN